MIRTTLTQRPLNNGSVIPEKIEELANRQIVTDLTSTPNPNPSITPLNSGRVSNVKKIAPKYTITVTNNDAAAQTVYLFNLDAYRTNDADVAITYSDGFSGKLLNKLAADADGILFFGFNITGYDADGVRSDSVVNDSALELRSYLGYGDSFVPTPIDISGAERNTQQKDGLFTVKTQFVVNCLTQLKMYLAPGTKIQLVLFTQPIQD